MGLTHFTRLQLVSDCARLAGIIPQASRRLLRCCDMLGWIVCCMPYAVLYCAVLCYSPIVSLPLGIQHACLPVPE